MIKGQKKTEIILYVVLWTFLFAAPLVSMLVDDFEWQIVFNAWSLLAMFCITFFLHNFFIAPLLVYGNRKWAYAVSTLALIVCFVGYQIHFRPQHPGPEPELEPKNKPELYKRPEPKDRPEQYKRPEPKDRPGPGMEHWDEHFHEKKPEPPRAFGGQDPVAFIIMALLLGLNIGAKSFFKSLDDKKRIEDLERENLNNQLEYLKYQINPHFFMNTLNNIHALVDIAPEQAKYTIEVLSKLMRYVLYEGNKTMAPLQKELDFISHYVDLMRIRYTDKVRISVSLPSSVPDVQVPSLLFITFVENAFKHGVSYKQSSFIEVAVLVDETIHEIAFSCNNSVKPETEGKKPGGVGLQNARKRLQLIYDDDYKLKIDSNTEEFRLLLRLPIK